MPGILKIGMTERSPEERLRESNCSDTWRPPLAYTLEFAIKVNNVKEKEASIHRVLELFKERVNPKREFFRASIDEVKALFSLLEGEFYTPCEAPEQEPEVKTKKAKPYELEGEWVGKYDADKKLLNFMSPVENQEYLKSKGVAN
jgi:hypothetical protein